MPTAGSSWVVWNLFDFPAGILPITKVNERDEIALNTSYPRNDMVFFKKHQHILLNYNSNVILCNVNH